MVYSPMECVHVPTIVKLFGSAGNTIIPEIQATAKPPSAQTMYRAIGVLYTLLAVAYIPISIAGYWVGHCSSFTETFHLQLLSLTAHF